MDLTIVRIEPDENGAHDNQTCYNFVIPIEEGYAMLPDTVATPTTQYYPYATIETTKIKKSDIPPGMSLELFGDRDEIDVVTKWTPIAPPPSPDPEPEDTTTLEDLEEAMIEMDMANQARFDSIEEAILELDALANS